ncbi:hypothetical protein RJD38_18925 [Vibrio scophthalmi]|uniref:Uncharacterized protein n=1 Tax=Vibrio scophthalmi TaxID=45658 RepID=A0A1C7FEB9_9VIBR|nr:MULTISPECIES: hypothetical protein [Vibrionaceae]ANU38282.1 hypothetical protein VSVS05_03244 [Vibrio scophthalmi]OOF22638.1 hypothetical protein BZJ19_14505 [Salinivibrio proteolyticus]
MNKVVLVKSYFVALGKEVTVKIPTGETKTGLFGGQKEVTRKEKQWKQTGWSDCEIDTDRLATDLEQVINSLNREGYKVQSVTPVMSGAYDFKYQAQGISSSARIMGNTEAVSGGASFGYGYGYSYTDSLIVIAEKNV